MLGRLAAAAALLTLAACAGVEPVGRNAQQGPSAASAPTPTPTPAPAPAPAPRTVAAAPAPAIVQPAPVAQAPIPAPAPRVTAQAPAAAPPTPAPQTTESTNVDVEDDAIVVPGQRDVQVPPPSGDPRSRAERMEDVRAWDQCVTAAQSAFESDPMRPQLDSPEEYCSRNLGMRDRTSVPAGRRVRR